jgi:hypothetical protein
MSSSGILGSVGLAAAANSGLGKSASAGTSSSSETSAQWFLNYMKETPAQRFEDSWLAAHGLTEKDLAKMSPQKREAILQQMANDMKQKVDQKTQTTLMKSAASLG